LLRLALISPEPRHAHSCTQLPGFRLLRTRDCERPLERSRLIVRGGLPKATWTSVQGAQKCAVRKTYYVIVHYGLGAE